MAKKKLTYFMDSPFDELLKELNELDGVKGETY